jgi:iron-sulfur cluster assembly accessory protein
MPLSFDISDTAITELSSIQKRTDQFLRITILSGGCSGLQYQFDLEIKTEADDIVIEKDGAKVVIDPTSYPFLENASLTYEQELIGSYFKITNPNADKSCGCGGSFSI